MYLGVGIFIIICIFFFYLRFYRKPCAIRKVCRLCVKEKCCILSDLITPFGYAYDEQQDIFTSRIDAWQRHYGYCTLFDATAPFFQMVFDCEPVYFNYKGCTWMIEFWKGQYGINTGCEVGVYKADRLLRPSERKHTLFYGVSGCEMLPLEIRLCKNGRPLFALSKCHWWLTGFCMGMFSKPRELQLTVSITFPNCDMMHAFTEALQENGYCQNTFCIEDHTVTLFFDIPESPQPCRHFRLRRAIAQCMNRLFCWIYRRITRPFCKNIDRLLYLYYFLPFAFRKMITIRKPRKRRRTMR